MTKSAEKKIRVLVVDDSAFMCKVLQQIINADPQLEVVGQGRDGRDGVALAEALRPDVITMDINMPHVDGLQATELIMSQHPRPIVIVSSESREGAASTLKALELGAIDFVPKPSSGIDLDMKSVGDELTRKLKLAAKVRVVRTATRSKLPIAQTPITAGADLGGSAALSAQNAGKFPMVVIAASTGGPAAVTRVVAGLPREFPAAVFLVLHMPATFTKQFTLQLSEVATLPVKEAESNETPQPGTIYLCPGSHHLAALGERQNLARSGATNRRLSPMRGCGPRKCRSLCAPADDRRRVDGHGERRGQGRESREGRGRLRSRAE